mmetsp:Transcript_5175/g.14841  ORF Transcript_5175/g.14841 Transcript_5175/m.14841 type:complete len:468 (+) Transcript_5175:687-2090(+)
MGDGVGHRGALRPVQLGGAFRGSAARLLPRAGRRPLPGLAGPVRGDVEHPVGWRRRPPRRGRPPLLQRRRARADVPGVAADYRHRRTALPGRHQALPEDRGRSRALPATAGPLLRCRGGGLLAARRRGERCPCPCRGRLHRRGLAVPRPQADRRGDNLPARLRPRRGRRAAPLRSVEDDRAARRVQLCAEAALQQGPRCGDDAGYVGAGGNRPEHVPCVAVVGGRHLQLRPDALGEDRGAEARVHAGRLSAHGQARPEADPCAHLAARGDVVLEQRLPVHGDRHRDQRAHQAGGRRGVERTGQLQGQDVQSMRGYAPRISRELCVDDLRRAAYPPGVVEAAAVVRELDPKDAGFPLRLRHPCGRQACGVDPRLGTPDVIDSPAGVPADLHHDASPREGRPEDGRRRQRAHAADDRVLQGQARPRSHLSDRQWHPAAAVHPGGGHRRAAPGDIRCLHGSPGRRDSGEA